MKPQINPDVLMTVDRLIEALIYLFVVFMFTDFGAAFRSIGMYGAFSLWLVKVSLTRQIDLPKIPVTYLFFAFLGSATLSTVLSSDLAISLRAYKREVIKPLLLFLVVATHFRTIERQKRLLVALGISAAIVLSFGYWNYFQGDSPEGRLVAFRNPNGYAMNLGYLLPFLFALTVLAQSWPTRVLWGSLAILGVIADVLTLSRGGWVALFAILVIWTVYQARTNKRLVFGIALLLLVLVPITLTNPSVMGRMSLSTENVATLGERTGVWRVTTAAIAEKSVIGWGIGQPIFLKVFAERGAAWHGGKPSRLKRYQHNVYLQVLFRQGVIGLVPYLLLIPAVVWDVRRGRHDRDARVYPMALAGLSALVAVYWVHGIFDTVRWVPFGLVLGWITAVANRGGDQSSVVSNQLSVEDQDQEY